MTEILFFAAGFATATITGWGATWIKAQWAKLTKGKQP